MIGSAITVPHFFFPSLFILFMLHKSINNTLIYISLEASLFNPTNDEFTVIVYKNVKEAYALVETCFEYVTGEYNDGGKIFRKRK